MTTAADLKQDIKANASELGRLATMIEEGDDPKQVGHAVVAHLRDTLWPFLDGLIDHMAVQEEILADQSELVEELEEVIDEMTDRQGDLLTPQTAGVFATVILIGRQIADLAEQRQPVPADLIGQFRIASEAAETVIKQITVHPTDDERADDDDDDDDDEEDDDGDE